MASKTKRLLWIDLLKALALIWIFLNHVSERLLGSPYFGNPDKDWPTLAERVAQIHPLSGLGIWTVPANILRYVGWAGDNGVSLFLILSGFGLVWGQLSKDPFGPLKTADFYRRRLIRIYPLWWTAHACFLLPLAIIGLHVSLIQSAFYASVIGIRILPNEIYYGVAAWWFIALILQLYLVFPALFKMLQSWGPVRFLLIIGGGALLVRAAGLFYFNNYLDAWSRGAVFITRLPEFAAGMALAVWYQNRKSTAGVGMLAALGAIVFAIGVGASFTLPGMAVAPLLAGLGSLAFLYALVTALSMSSRVLDWIGRHSLSVYLVHQPIVDALLPRAGRPMGTKRLAIGFTLAIVVTAIAAMALEKIASAVVEFLNRARHRWGNRGLFFRLAAVALVAWAMLVAGEIAVRKWNPQEPVDLGWGERESLQPSATFGWNLKPDRSTRLRWESYDYVVTANSLGFPAPEYPEAKDPGTFRILVTGDAFTSAEGVDTNQSWPRLLEKRLAETTNLHPQVMNFAITGYGPNQYLAVVKTFVPKFKPDLILIGLFINDYGDVLESDDEFRAEIGFGLPNPNGSAAILTCRQLAGLLRTSLMREVYQRILHKPDPTGYLLGHFHFVQVDCPELSGEGRDLMSERLGEIKQIAGNTPVVIVMIPSAAQVADPATIQYWPKYVNISDPSQFDLDLPQRVTREIAANLSLRCYDLREPLREAGDVYQPRNMHWTLQGHQTAANYLAAVLQADGYFTRPSPSVHASR